MIKSMTGYGRHQQMIDGREITVEIKSVNHRFFEFSARVPRALGFLEEKLKSYIQPKVSRGKVDVNVTVVTMQGTNINVDINRELAASYLRSLREIAGELKLRDDITVMGLSRFSDIFVSFKKQEDEQELWEGVRAVAAEALQKFIRMREEEGERLQRDIIGRVEMIEALVTRVEELSPQTVVSYRQQLTNKMIEILGENRFDEQRILTEAAIFAERIAVAEETVRLKSHIGQFRDIIESGEPVGRKLDFLVQEFNREINTIGSKAQDTAVVGLVIEMKSETEKIREQIQNIE